MSANKDEKAMSVKVDCTWGDGPDILLSLSGKGMILLQDPTKKDKWVHGVVTEGSMDLTVDEALALASQLQLKAIQVREEKQVCKDHDEAMENNE
jgi:hypothetical protein